MSALFAPSVSARPTTHFPSAPPRLTLQKTFDLPTRLTAVPGTRTAASPAHSRQLRLTSDRTQSVLVARELLPLLIQISAGIGDLVTTDCRSVRHSVVTAHLTAHSWRSCLTHQLQHARHGSCYC